LATEIQEGFPRFQLNKDWSIVRCRFFQTLDNESQMVFGQGLLQSRHQNAVKALAEVISSEAAVLMRREEAFRSENSAWARGSALESRDGKQPLATRREIKRVMAAHCRAAFGDECNLPEPSDEKTGLQFRMACHGWVIKTELECGRWDPEITCVHDVWTGKLITKADPQVLFANCLGFQMSYGNEIGIGSGWERIAVADVERTCLAVVEHCHRMFDVLPGLLNHLDLELLTA
jgi:hypothetical protein